MRYNVRSATGILVVFFLSVSMFYGCSASAELLTSRSGAQIWGENCIRCHNAPSPDTFSDVEWDVAGMHMRIRGNLTHSEITKVVEFLQSAN